MPTTIILFLLDFSLGGVTDQFGRILLFITLKTQNNLELKNEENFNKFLIELASADFALYRELRQV